MLQPEDIDKEALQDQIDLVEESENQRAQAEQIIERKKQAERAEQFAAQQTAIDDGNAAKKGLMETAEKGEQSGFDQFMQAGSDLVDTVGGIKESVIDRGQNVGIARGLNGVFTLPERAWDFATGAMQEEKEQTGSYSPGWDPFREYIDDNKAENLWELGTQIAFQEATTIGSAVLTGGITGLTNSRLGRIGIAGFEAVLNPDVSSENNFSGSVKWIAENPDKSPEWVQDVYLQLERTVPWLGDSLRHVAINNPLATTEGDDVYTTTFKAVLENILTEGAGEILDFVWGSRRADEMNVEGQTAQKAEDEYLEDMMTADADGLPSNTIDVEATDVTTSPSGGRPELPQGDPDVPQGTWRASKNSPTAGPGQGKYNPTVEPDVQWARARKMRDEPNDMGTVGNGFDAADLERYSQTAGIPIAKQNEIAKKLYDSAYYQQAMGKRDWAAGNIQALRRFSKILGTNVSDMTPDQFWKKMFEKLGKEPTKYPIDPVVSDLITQDLFSQIRNRGMAGNSLMATQDIMDTDGPMHLMAQRLALFGNETAKARKAFSDEILALPPAKQKQAMDDFSVEDYGYVSKKTEDFFRFIKEQPDDELAQFANEMFSKQNIQSMDQLQNYLRHKFRGDKFKGAKGKRALIKEMNLMTMLAQLALPKTLLKAAKGSLEILGINSVGKIMGATARMDMKSARAAAAELRAVQEVWGEGLQLWKKNIDAWWNKDFANMGNRFTNRVDPREDIEFQAYREMTLRPGSKASLGEKVYVQILGGMKDLNKWQPFSYVMPSLTSIDQTIDLLGANMAARNKAVKEMLNNKKPWEGIDQKDFQEARNNYLRAVVDKDGNIDFDSDLFLQAQTAQAKLTKPISGPLKHLDRMVEEFPEMSVFYRYMTTRINDLMFSYKMLPGLGLLHKEYMDIHKALRSGDFTETMQYGISSMDEAKQAMDIWHGRNALGGMILWHFLGKKQDNELTGNGTLDYRINDMWKKAGWKERTITYGPVEISLDSFSGLGGLIALASDVVDNRKFMGDKWADQNLATIVFAIGQSMTTKELFEPVNAVMALGRPGGLERWTASMASSIHGGKWFDALGKVLLPYQKEITKSLNDQMRNRFQGGELFRSEEDRLQPVRDTLYGTEITPWDYVAAGAALVSPFRINIREDRPATDMLLASGYPTKIITNQHDGIPFEGNREIRDAYNAALEQQGLGKALEREMQDPKFMQSLEQYHEDLETGNVKKNPVGSYYHLTRINDVVNAAKDEAWMEISDRPDVQELVDKKEQNAREQRESLFTTGRDMSVFDMTNK